MCIRNDFCTCRIGASCGKRNVSSNTIRKCLGVQSAKYPSKHIRVSIRHLAPSSNDFNLVQIRSYSACE